MEEVFKTVQGIICDTLDVEADQITMDANLKEDLDADSLDAVEVIMAIEDEYGVDIDDDAIPNITTVSDLVNYIVENR